MRTDERLHSNNYFARHYDYFAPAAHELPLLHMWSLAVEMQFYLLLPVVLVVVARRFLPWVLSAVIALFLAYSVHQLVQGHSQSIYFSLVARIPEFLVGGLLALVPIGTTWSRQTRNMVAWVGLAIILGSFILIKERSAFSCLLAMPACIGVAMLLTARDSNCNHMLSNVCFVSIGGISYSLYLWHWPILVGVRYSVQNYALQNSVIVIAILVTTMLAYFSYHMIEVPFRNGVMNFRKALKCLALIFALVISLSGAAQLNSRLIKPLPEGLTRYAPLDEICHGKVLDSCARGDKSADKKILLMGDSHAAQLNYFADVVGEMNGIQFEVVTASGCVPIDGFDYDRISEGARKACRDQIEQVKRRFSEVKGIVVAGKWDSHTQSERFMSAFQSFLESMSANGLPVLVLAQFPEVDGNVQRVLRLKEFGLSTSMERSVGWALGNEKISDLVSRYSNTSFLDLSNASLFLAAPFYRGVNIYFDQHHLNEEGAKQYGLIAAPEFAKWSATHFK